MVAPEGNNIDLEQEIKRGEDLFAQGEVKAAEEVFLSLLKKAPNNSEILNNLGVINHTSGQHKEAETFFSHAFEVNPHYKDALLNLSALHQEARRWKEAGKLLERVLSADEGNIEALNQLALIYLETSDRAQAITTLKRSLAVNPDQPDVGTILSDLQKPVIQTSTDNPLNILFVQESPCIRNYKMATALRLRGHRVSLAYTKARLSQMYSGLSDDVYDEITQIQSHRQFWDLTAKYDLVHCHNEPDVLTVAALAGAAPVIHDTHDLISLRASGDPNLSFFEGVANRGAAGRVYTTPYQREEARRLYGAGEPSVILYNYASSGDLPRKYHTKISAKDGGTHVVYEGGIGGTAHRDFWDLFKDLAQRSIHVHIYPVAHQPALERQLNNHPFLHYHHPVSPRDIMTEMTRYDFGIIPFNLEKGNKRFLDSTIANKLFEYLAAGLPVFASPLQSYVNYFASYPVGLTFTDAADLQSKIPEMFKLAEKIDFSQHMFTYENEITTLEQFYLQVLKNSSRGKRPSLPMSDSPILCYLCGRPARKMHRSDPFDVVYCPVCDLSFLHPLPSDAFLRLYYSEAEKKKRWDGNLNRAIEVKHAQNDALDPVYYEFMNRHLDLEGTGKVLEIGCYSGRFLKRLADMGYTCEGIDLNEGFVAYGKKKYGLDLHTGTLFDRKYPNATFDIVIFHQVMEHLADPAGFLKEVRRILKPGGFICFSVPNTGSPLSRVTVTRQEAGGKPLYLDIPNHIFYFTKNAIRRLLKQVGFTLTAESTYLSPSRWKGMQDRCDTEAEKAWLTAMKRTAEERDDLPGLLVMAPSSRSADGEPKENRSRKAAAPDPVIPPEVIVNQSPYRPLLDLDKTQWLSAGVLRGIQNHFLRLVVREAWDHVPYYRDSMDRAGIQPGAVQSISDLKALPVIDKSVFRAQGSRMVHSNAAALQTHATATGGSTGEALKYRVTPEVYYYGFGCRDRGFRWAGYDPSSHRMASLAGGSLGVTGRIETEGNHLKIPATGVHSREVLDSYFEALKDFKPDFMRAYPSALHAFCTYLQETGKTLQIPRVVTTAEMLYPHQRKHIESVLGCRVFNEYGAYDGGAGAFECEQHEGLHLAMERGIVELLDDAGEPARPGDIGRVVVTDLHNYVFPFIRYDVGDRATVLPRPCVCGRGLERIEKLEGRSSDYILLGDGTRLAGEAVIHLFNKMLQEDRIDVRQYQAVQKKDRSVEIRLIPGGHAGSGQNAEIRQWFESHLKGVEVRIVSVESLEQTAAGKTRFVFSQIPENKVDREASQFVRVTSCARPKICHVGGAHSVHVADIVKALDEKGYEQCVFSYSPAEQAITPTHIPVYSFPYRSYNHPDWKRLGLESKVREVLGTVIRKEEPDLIHGHSLTYACVPVWMAKTDYHLPATLMSWSIHTIREPDPVANAYERKCIRSLDYFMHPMPAVFKMFQKFYGEVPDEKLVIFRTLLDLSSYAVKRESVFPPRILSARVMGPFYRQDLLIWSLPDLVHMYPELKVTLIIGQSPEQGKSYFDDMKRLADELGVSGHCTFIPEALSQGAFSRLIQSHPIVYSMSVHDEGFSGTTIQAAYSGAVTIVNDIPEIDGIFDHNVHVLRTTPDEEAVKRTLIYAWENLETLSERFRKNNAGLIRYGKEAMLQNLMQCYSRMINSESKIHFYP